MPMCVSFEFDNFRSPKSALHDRLCPFLTTLKKGHLRNIPVKVWSYWPSDKETLFKEKYDWWTDERTNSRTDNAKAISLRLWRMIINWRQNIEVVHINWNTLNWCLSQICSPSKYSKAQEYLKFEVSVEVYRKENC